MSNNALKTPASSPANVPSKVASQNGAASSPSSQETKSHLSSPSAKAKSCHPSSSPAHLSSPTKSSSSSSSATPELNLSPPTTARVITPEPSSPDSEDDQLIADKEKIPDDVPIEIDTDDDFYASEIDFRPTQELINSTKAPSSSQPLAQPSTSEKSKKRVSTLSPVPDSKSIVNDTPKPKRRPIRKRKMESEPSPAAAFSSTPRDHSSSAPPAKRPKATPSQESKPSFSLNGRTLHAEHWNPDGSIIVQVEKTLFKLFGSTMKKLSPVFVSMIADAETSGDVIEQMAGCNVYYLDTVDVVDFERLLTATLRAISYFNNPPPFPVMASILRAATELQVEDFREWATNVLEKTWPVQLPAPSKSSSFSDKIPWAVETVHLGTRYHVPQVVRRAMYELVRSPNFQQPGNQTINTDGVDDAPRRAKLTTKFYLKLVDLRYHLVSSWSRIILAPMDVGCKRATAADVVPPIQSCSQNHHGWIEILTQDPSIRDDGFLDPITALEKMILSKSWTKDDEFCEDCVKIWKESWIAERQKLWNNLDVWLDLRLDE